MLSRLQAVGVFLFGVLAVGAAQAAEFQDFDLNGDGFFTEEEFAVFSNAAIIVCQSRSPRLH